MYLSRQIYEEALHVQFYLTLLDSYIPDLEERERAFAAIHNVPSIARKGEFCFRWMDSVESIDRLESRADRRRFLLNLIMGRILGATIGLSLTQIRSAGAQALAAPDALSPPESTEVAAVVDGDRATVTLSGPDVVEHRLELRAERLEPPRATSCRADEVEAPLHWSVVAP